MLMRRDDLMRIDGLATMAASVADDQALAKAMRRHGLGTCLVEGVALQAGGPRSLGEVWRRHLRWALCRRLEAPLAFAIELFLGLAAAMVAIALAAPALGLSAPLSAAALACLWIAVEVGLAVAKGWPVSWRGPAAILMREIMMPAIWGAALATRRIRWGGQEIAVGRSTGARPA
jgi:ceramide glucosyltransferase